MRGLRQPMERGTKRERMAGKKRELEVGLYYGLYDVRVGGW